MAEREANRTPTHGFRSLMCDFVRFAPIIAATVNPAVGVFLFPRRTPRVSNEPAWAAGKRTHGTHSHGVYPSRRVSERPHKMQGQWWDKPCTDESLTSVAVGASHGWRYWQGAGYHLWGTYGREKNECAELCSQSSEQGIQILRRHCRCRRY